MPRFDSRALFEALDERRSSRGMTWSQVAVEIGVSASTLRHTRAGGRMEVDGMLAMVDWLKVPVETFVRRDRSDLSRSGRGTQRGVRRKHEA
jgi:transcriptional regulator with XRE-family HTH domain